jgi:hypothetical protein
MQFKQFYGSIVITKPCAKVITIEPSQDALNYVLRWFVMTCYFRHLKEIFKKAGIEVTGENKREIDRIIHNIVCGL